jgi:hypothetical protein
MTLTVLSYGGGVQSTALLVLSALGELPPIDAALFCNVGDDSEHPASLEYVRNVAQPWAAERGVKVIELDRVKRDGTVETLYGRLTKPGARSVGIPVRMANGAPGNRSCTADFKIRVVAKWLKQHGATNTDPATVWIGISTDEIQRVKGRSPIPHETVAYPLIDLGLDRSRCMSVIADAGLPVPPKSSCYFCPFHRPQMWAEMRRDEPELFEKSARLEEHLNTVRDRIGKDHIYFTDRLKPLRVAIPEAQDMLPMFDESPDTITGCDEGHCWT